MRGVAGLKFVRVAVGSGKGARDCERIRRHVFGSRGRPSGIEAIAATEWNSHLLARGKVLGLAVGGDTGATLHEADGHLLVAVSLKGGGPHQSDVGAVGRKGDARAVRHVDEDAVEGNTVAGNLAQLA